MLAANLLPAHLLQLQRAIGNQAVVALLKNAGQRHGSPASIRRSGLSTQIEHLIGNQDKATVFLQLGQNRAALAADHDVMTLINATYRGDDLWIALALLAHGPEAGWPIEVAAERAMKSGGTGKGTVFSLLRAAAGAQLANAGLTAALLRIFPAGSDDLWLARALQAHGSELAWPIEVRAERAMKSGGTGKDTVFALLRAAAGAQAGNAALTAALLRIFPAGSDDLWLGQALQAHGAEAAWPIEVTVERAMKSGGTGKGTVFAVLGAAAGAQAGNAALTAALLRIFPAGTNDLWLAQALQANGPDLGWPRDLKVERILRGLAGAVDQAAILVLLLAATAPEFANSLAYMSTQHNTVLIEMLYAANVGQFDQFMAKMDGAQTRTFLDNVSTWNSVYYSTFMARIKTGRLLATGQANVGNFRWRGGSGPDPAQNYQVRTTTAWGHADDFARWIRDPVNNPVPTNASVMNCWEGVLFLAYRAGLVDLAWLQQIHQAAATAGNTNTGNAQAKAHAYYAALERSLYSGSRTRVTFDGTGRSSPDIPAGRILFINGMDHVLLAKGTRDGTARQQVLSLWIFPAHLPAMVLLNQLNSYGVLQDTTLEEVHPVARRQATDRIEFGAAPW